MRDGLQSVPHVVPTEAKIRLVEGLILSGVKDIEVVSFAHPKVLPQMADAEDLLNRVPRSKDVRYRALVPNAVGARRAVDAGVDEIVILTCTDADVLMINQRRTPQQMWQELDQALAIARDGQIGAVVAIIMSFYAYGAGVVPEERLDEMVGRIVEAGATSLYVADSAGLADPKQVYGAIVRLRRAHPEVEIGVHLHTRGGFALANTLAALMAGVDWIESAFGGLGGDLWLPGDHDVLGNMPTEDLVAMLGYMGVETGIELEPLMDVVRLCEEQTGRHPLGHFGRGGSRSEMAAIEWEEIMSQPGKSIPSTG